MEQAEELGSTFVVAVDELGYTGLWSSIKDILVSRLPVQKLLLANKLGKVVEVDKLPLQYVLSTDKRLQRLKPFSKSPVTWFRNPYAHVILVSTADINEYRSTVRNNIKRVATEIERDWGGTDLQSEWLILYVRPFELDTNDRSCKRVFEKIKDDFSSRRRERCVRLDLPHKAFDSQGRKVDALGLPEFDDCLKDCVKASFETRQLTYNEEVKKLLTERREPSWSFTTLYLVKDSFALMLECAGLHEDAFKEYAELERAYTDALKGAMMPKSDFGASRDGDDTASLLSANWRDTRRLVLKNSTIPEFRFRQYLFAAQARVLIKLGRPLEVAERGLAFVQSFCDLISEREAQGQARPLLREAWAFSACLALIVTTRDFLSRGEQLQVGWDPELQLPSALAPDWSGLAASGRGPGGSNINPQLKRTNHMRNVSLPVVSVGQEDLKSRSVRSRSAAGSPHDSASSGPPVPKGPFNVSWELGLKVDPEELKQLDLSLLAGQVSLPTTMAPSRSFDAEHRQRDAQDRAYHCLLGHLYSLALSELLRMAARVGQAPPPPAAPAANGAAGSHAWDELLQLVDGRLCRYFSLVGRPQERLAVKAEMAYANDTHRSTSAPSLAAVSSGPAAIGAAAAAPLGLPLQRNSMQESLVSWMKRPSSPFLASRRASEEPGSSGVEASGGSMRNNAISALDLASMKLFGSRSITQQRTSDLAKALESAGSADSSLRHNSSVPNDLMALGEEAAAPAAPQETSTQLSQLSRASLRGVPESAELVPAPTWLSDWRLKMAVAGGEAFEELTMELAGLTGWCYNKAGRLRNAALLHMDVAAVTIQRGRVEAACRLLERMQAILAAEGWWQLLGALLPRVVACQRLIGHVMLPYTMMQLLALPPDCATRTDRSLLLSQLVEYATSTRQDHSAGIQLNTLQALQVAPLSGSFSRFYGRCNESGHPLLAPPACPRGSSATSDASPDQDLQGASQLCVGDTVAVVVDVHSALPGPVEVTSVALVLTQLVLINSFRVNSSYGTRSSPALSTIGGFSASSASSSSSAFLAAAAAGMNGLVGSLSSNSMGGLPPMPGSPGMMSSGASPGAGPGLGDLVMQWQEAEELVCTRLLEVRRRSSEGTSTSAPAPLDGAITLAPGCTQLVFEVAPLRDGLYVLKHVTALLGSCSLLMGMVPRHLLQEADVGAAAARHVPPGTGAGSAQMVGASQVGQAMAGGGVHEEVVVLQVDPPLQRLAVAAVGAGGCLIAGHCQWVGMFVRPLHDELSRARLHIASRMQPAMPSGTLDTTQGPCRVDVPSGQRACLLPLDKAEATAAGDSHEEETAPTARRHSSHSAAKASMRNAVSSGDLLNVELDPQPSNTLPDTNTPDNQPTEGPTSEMVTELPTETGSPRREESGEPLGAPGEDHAVEEAAEKLEAMELAQRDGETSSSDASTSGRDAGGSGAGVWVPVVRGMIELSQHLRGGSLSDPLLVWIQLAASCAPRSPEMVRVHRPEPLPTPRGGAGGASQLRQSLMSPSAILTPTGLMSPGGPLTPTAEEKLGEVAAELDVNLEYHSGCWRTHHSMLRLPVLQPLEVQCTAHALPNGQVVLHVAAKYLVPYPATVLECSVTPQYGVEVIRTLAQELLPMHVQPNAQLGFSFLLKRQRGSFAIGQYDDQDASVVSITYSISPTAPCHTVSQEMATAASTSPLAWEQPYPQPPDSIPPADPPPSTPGTAGHLPSHLSARRSDDTPDAFTATPPTTPSHLIAEAAAALQQRSPRGDPPPQSAHPHAGTHMHQHRLILEFPDSARAENVVRVALLGPSAASIGQMVALSWQVTRIKSHPASSGRGSVSAGTAGDGSTAEDEAIYFEVADSGGEGKNWRLHQAKGSLRLGRARGSLATVEVMVTALTMGPTPAPRLLLRGVTDDGQRSAVELVHVHNQPTLPTNIPS